MMGRDKIPFQNFGQRWRIVQGSGVCVCVCLSLLLLGDRVEHECGGLVQGCIGTKVIWSKVVLGRCNLKVG